MIAIQSKASPDKRSAFTLIELMVVISIIAMLASILVAALHTSKVKAADAHKIVEVNSIGTGLRMYYANKNFVPGNYNSSGTFNPAGNGNQPACENDSTGGAAYNASMQQMVNAGILGAIPHSIDSNPYCYYNYTSPSNNDDCATFYTAINYPTPGSIVSTAAIPGAPAGSNVVSNVSTYCVPFVQAIAPPDGGGGGDGDAGGGGGGGGGDFGPTGEMVTGCGGTYGVVLAKDGREWLDRNLGATEVATSLTDAAAYGSMYQWGRYCDGHENPTSSIISIQSTTDTPGHGMSIALSGIYPHDWRNPQNDNLWQGVTGINNPCPSGFRVPTATDWQNLIAAEGITNHLTAFSSTLKFPAVTYRYLGGPLIGNDGTWGFYWTSTPYGILSTNFIFSSSNAFTQNVGVSNARDDGLAIRCIRN